jgi:hypothetical protein
MNPPDHWSLDPREVDRFLEEDLLPAERIVREAEAASDASVASRLAARRDYLRRVSSALRRDGAAERDARDLASLEARVRDALARDRAGLPAGRTGRRLALAALPAAALLLVAWTLGLLGGGAREAEATPAEVVRAADLLRAGPVAARPVGGCTDEDSTSPFRFPLVAQREMAVRGCADPAGEKRTEAVLIRLEDLSVVGFVAVPDPGTKEGPEIGVTRFEDAVVFDVRIGGAAYYLAVPREVVERRGSCAACHSPARAASPNPHRLMERALPGSSGSP